MGFLSMLVLCLTHPNDFRALVQFWMMHEPKRDIASMKEHATSGWDRKTMRRCWELLDTSSRSFATVIKELDGDLARTVRTQSCARLFMRCYTLFPFLVAWSPDLQSAHVPLYSEGLSILHGPPRPRYHRGRHDHP